MKMNKNFTLAGIAMAVFMMFNSASASLLIEPHIGYNVSGSGDATFGSTKYEYDYTGPQFGARLGYQGLGLMAGLDYTRSTYDFKRKFAGTGSEETFDRNEVGLFVGYDFPILLRAWGTYYFMNKSKNDSGTTEYSGNTKELGVGFTALPFLSINVMYRMVTFDEDKGSALSTDINLNEIVLGVSLPLNL